MNCKPTVWGSRWLKNGAIALAFAIVSAGLGSQGAMATSSPSIAELQKAVATLEARVAALEEKLQRSETVAGQQEASMPRPLLASLAGESVRPAPMMVAPATQPVALQEQNGWSGLYWGTSFGGAATRSNVKSSETYTDYEPTSMFPYMIDGTRSASESDGDDHGALLDLFVGVNKQVGQHFVAGLQAEGTIGEVGFDSEGSRRLTYFDGAGPTGQTATGPFRPHVQSRYMVSALARAGWLVDQGFLLYGLAGWTGASFEYQNVTDNPFFQPDNGFWANGITFGGGAEHKLGPNWTLRAEYRFTRFEDKDVDNTFSWSSSVPSAQTNTIATQFDNTMQVGRIGISRYFNLGN